MGVAEPYQVRLIAYDIMLRFWSLVFPHYQLPITNYQPTRQYKYSREHDIKIYFSIA
jgi:hypothetical protein